MTETEQLMLYNQQKSDSQFPPCYDRHSGEHCTERFVGCHSQCKRYLEYRAHQDKRLEEQHKKSQESRAREENFQRCEKIHNRRIRKK